MAYRRIANRVALAICLGKVVTYLAASPAPAADAGLETRIVRAADDAANPTTPANPIRPWTTGTRATNDTKGTGAQGSPFIKENGILWAKGQGEGLLGGIARVKIDTGARLTEARGVRTWLTQRSLPVSGNEIGMIAGPKGAWNALVVLLPVTNVPIAQVARQLPELVPDLLPRLASSFSSVPPDAGGAPAPLDWLMEPRVDDTGSWLQWCLERNTDGRLQRLPGAAFFTARGIVVVHFFGSAELIPGICFASLRNISILPAANPGSTGPFNARVFSQILAEPRIVTLGQRAAAAPGSRANVAQAATNTNRPADAPARAAKAEPDAGEPRRFGDNTDQIVLGMLAVAGLVVFGLLFSTTPVKRGRRRRRPAPTQHRESARP